LAHSSKEMARSSKKSHGLSTIGTAARVARQLPTWAGEIVDRVASFGGLAFRLVNKHGPGEIVEPSHNALCYPTESKRCLSDFDFSALIPAKRRYDHSIHKGESQAR
jgi:hypothetical protein